MGPWRQKPNVKGPLLRSFTHCEVVRSVRQNAWLTWEDSNLDIPD